ncbi:MAG: polysaccharide biosynthesis C-terminal domain-containing protein [Acidimicrobiia bacterium]
MKTGDVPAPTEPVVDLAETAVEMGADHGGDFGGFLRSAGKLAVARQVSALVFIGVVFVLPALTERRVATDFVWAYFAMLTLTSLLGLGLERLAATESGARGSTPLARAIAPVLFVRLVTAPLAAIGMVLLFAFVDVHLSAAAWVATFAWVVAGLMAPVVFGGLRAAGNGTLEPVTMVVVRAAQAATLAALATSGAPVAVMVACVATLELAGVAAALRGMGNLGSAWGAWTQWRRLPLRRAAALAGIEGVAVLNLRADLLLVGRMLGAAPGATYGLLYRVVDGFSGVVGSAGLWLYAESANERDGGTDPTGIRARSLVLLPRFGLLAATVVVLAAGLVGHAVPRLGDEVDTLRILAIAFPLLSLNAVELHVRSGRGRNREILGINVVVLLTNVALCIVAVDAYGLPGAAVALAVTELLQGGLLWRTASSDERALLGPALGTATLGAAFLAVTVVALGMGQPVVAGLAVGATLAVVLWRARRPVRRTVVVS